MAARMRIAAAACVVISGLFVAGAGAALAFANPDAGQGGETSGTPADPTGGGTTAPTSGQAPLDETAPESVPAVTPTVTAPKPTSQVGDGRNGLDSDDPGTAREAPTSSKISSPGPGLPSQTGSAAAGEPRSSGLAAPARASAAETTTATTTKTTAPDPAPDGDDDQHQGWHWWPWCWPTPPVPGLPPGSGGPASSGNGGGGGVSVGKPPIGIGIPNPPPLMQLPASAIPRVVPPTLPVISVDPVVDVINGLATGAAELPFTPLTLPVIVPPLGAGGVGSGGGGGAGGAGSPGLAPRPGAPAAPKTSGGPQIKSQPPRSGAQNPPAFSASNGPVPASYRAGYGDYLRTAGIGQMAAVAVPGVTGILVLTGAGGLVGYRQARAGHTVRANGTARFIG